MRHVFLAALLLSTATVTLPAVAATLSPLPSNASWFDPATKTATSDELTADPNYSRIKKEEKAADSNLRTRYEAKCLSVGIFDVGCLDTTRRSLLLWARAYTNLPALCGQWKTFWKGETYSQLNLRNDMCNREANTSLYKHAMNGVDAVGCVCN